MKHPMDKIKTESQKLCREIGDKLRDVKIEMDKTSDNYRAKMKKIGKA